MFGAGRENGWTAKAALGDWNTLGCLQSWFAGNWAIRRDRNDDNGSARDEMEALCELAGGRLANSPGIVLSDAVRDQAEHWKTWLQFVKEVQGLNRTLDGPRA